MATHEPTTPDARSSATKQPSAPPMRDGRPASITSPPASLATVSSPSSHSASRLHDRKTQLLLGGGLLLLLVALFYGGRFAYRAWTTVSTDDAYVNSHVTFVAARVPGQVAKVLVDDNNRVHKDDLIVQLDPEPYQTIVNIKHAAVTTAEADLVAAQDQVRGMVALARSNRFKLQHAIEEVNNQVALLRANVAALETKKAVLVRAKADLERSRKLVDAGTITREEFDQRQEAAQVGEAQAKQALEAVYQVRVNLGLPAKPEKGDDLTQVP